MSTPLGKFAIRRETTYALDGERTVTIVLYKDYRGWWVSERNPWNVDIGGLTGPMSSLRDALDTEEKWAYMATKRRE